MCVRVQKIFIFGIDSKTSTDLSLFHSFSHGANQLWNIETGALVHTFQGHRAAVTCIYSDDHRVSCF